MSIYHGFKELFTKRVLRAQKNFEMQNAKKNALRKIKLAMRKVKTPELTSEQIKAAKAYYEAKGYKLNNTYWHRYYTGVTKVFHEDYVPLDIFRPISFKLNEKRQWPALLDKNLIYNLFKEFKQPVKIVQNINGFYFVNDRMVSKEQAVEACNVPNKNFIIKPTIESGKGKLVEVFVVENNVTSVNDLTTSALFKKYKKDFIVQELIEQSETLKSLNPSSLNTLRIVTYIREDGVHILSSAVRIGEPGSKTDNFSGGGMFCGIDEFGNLKPIGHTKDGQILHKTLAGTTLKGLKIPNYSAVNTMVKDMHLKVPYFRIASWDIGIDSKDMPIFVEYNTRYQGIEIQIPNGPLLGKFADEILALGKQPF